MSACPSGRMQKDIAAASHRWAIVLNIFESFSMNQQEEIDALAILIRDLRKHKKYSLKDLADKMGRSVGFLSQVERGISRPTVADLTAISETLGVPTTYFYAMPKRKEWPWVTRPNERRTLYFGNGITDVLVSPNMAASFAMLESHLEAGASSGERHLSDSSEQGGYVLEGELTVWLGDNDEQAVTLYAGDSFQLASHTRCRYGNLTELPTRVLWVYT